MHRLFEFRLQTREFSAQPARIIFLNPPCIVAALKIYFEVNSEPHTGARPSVRVYVGLIMVLFAPGRASGGPRRGLVPQAQAALLRFKYKSAVACPPRSYGQRLKLAEGPRPRRYIFYSADKAAKLRIYKVSFLLMQPHRGAGFLGELQ